MTLRNDWVTLRWVFHQVIPNTVSVRHMCLEVVICYPPREVRVPPPQTKNKMQDDLFSPTDYRPLHLAPPRPVASLLPLSPRSSPYRSLRLTPPPFTSRLPLSPRSSPYRPLRLTPPRPFALLLPLPPRSSPFTSLLPRSPRSSPSRRLAPFCLSHFLGRPHFYKWFPGTTHLKDVGISGSIIGPPPPLSTSQDDIKTSPLSLQTERLT